MSVMEILGPAVAAVVADSHWNGHGWDDGGWIVMGVGMVLFWGAVVAGIVLLVRALAADRAGGPPVRPEPTASELLERRLADGQISVEEFEERRRVLTGGGGGPAS